MWFGSCPMLGGVNNNNIDMMMNSPPVEPSNNPHPGAAKSAEVHFDNLHILFLFELIATKILYA